MDEWTLALGLLEQGHGDRPNFDDRLGHRAADPFVVNPADVFRKIERFECPP